VEPVLPDYGGACIANVVPALLGRHGDAPGWLPPGVATADRVVLLALDGLGWDQLRDRPSLAPTLAAMAGGPITSVVPSTTSTALTSLTTGSPPSRHGVVGYRVKVGSGDVLNVLRWRTARGGDARGAVPPDRFQTIVPFAGTAPPVVTRAEFNGGGFSGVHLAGARLYGWRMPSTLVTHVRHLVADGEEFVYAYYDGIDKVAHEFGLEEHYDAEVAYADCLVADLLDALPPGVALVVTSDHGQVHVGDDVVLLRKEVVERTVLLSGEGRFRWLHARPGQHEDLLEAAREGHGDQAWVRTRDQAESEGWFGGPLSAAAAARLGDVVLAATDPVAFLDPADTGEVSLVSRHGSLTGAEMRVPLLAASA
jgi:predicted AlkP superfamily pyrophosphatase or phosphodiesterase